MKSKILSIFEKNGANQIINPRTIKKNCSRNEFTPILLVHHCIPPNYEIKDDELLCPSECPPLYLWIPV